MSFLLNRHCCHESLAFLRVGGCLRTGIEHLLIPVDQVDPEHHQRILPAAPDCFALIPLDDTQIIRSPWQPELPGALIDRDARAGRLAAIGDLAQHSRFHQGRTIGL